jgi:hypothetical protein
MMDILPVISKRLDKIGMIPVEKNRFIRDVSILGGEKSLSVIALKNRLASLGWERDLLDDHTLGLIFVFLEEKGYI